MAKIKYDINLMKYISLFESITQAKVKDCFEEGEKLVFIVYPNEMGKAIGKNGVNVKRMVNMLNKQLKIVEFDDDVCEFIRKYVAPLRVDVTDTEGAIVIRAPDTKTRGLLLGREKANFIRLKDAVSRYFVFGDIKIQ
ncbi:MAG: NusA-like transcription termination signal-binding factor [Nanoarchaeota archaeon]|nr:NusA-like transcription termination signal-binding factor [Nanoarchaeota archaeon]MBU1704370.1 NusA-like transcription termination signal-binding factor [Nanoarchaeota archaeon]